MPPEQRIEAYLYMCRSVQRIGKWLFGRHLAIQPPFTGLVLLTLFQVLCGASIGCIASIVMLAEVLIRPIFHAPGICAPLWWSIALAPVFIAGGHLIQHQENGVKNNS